MFVSFWALNSVPLYILSYVSFCQHYAVLFATAKSLKSCPTVCDPIDGSPPGSTVPGSLQARTLEWVAISFSNAWKWKVKGKLLSCVQVLVTPWTAAHQVPLSMGFSRQEYWSGVPLPSPAVLFNTALWWTWDQSVWYLQLCYFSQDYFGYRGLWCCHINFRIFFVFMWKNILGILTWISLNL